MPRLSTSLKVAAAVALPLLCVGVVVERDIDKRWDQMAAHLDQLAEARRGKDTERDALYGDTVDGLAWPHYEFALTEMERVWERMPIHNYSAAEAKTPGERAERDALLLELEPAFEALRRGAHARDAATSVDLADGSLDDAGAIRFGHKLSIFAFAKAQSQFERGEDLAGVATLLDAQQLGRDMTVAPSLVVQMMGLAMLVNEYVLVWLTDGGAGQMSAEAKELWLDGMDRLRATIPVESTAMAGELERFGRGLRHTVEPEAPRIFWMNSPGWRGPSAEPGFAYQYSWRAAGADLVKRGPDFIRRAEAAYAPTGVVTLAALASLEIEMDRDDNPLLGYFGRRFVAVGRGRIYSMTKLDFLRYALALHLGRDAELPPDPWGRGVRVEVDGGQVRVWTPHGVATGRIDVSIGG